MESKILYLMVLLVLSTGTAYVASEENGEYREIRAVKC